MLRKNADITEFIARQKKAAMAGTPDQHGIGTFLFDRLAVTQPERDILAQFIGAYEGDFVADYLSVGDQDPRDDALKAAIDKSLTRIGPNSNPASLGDMKAQLFALIDNRRVAKKIVEASRQIVRSKYELASSEVEIFRDYANIQASDTGSPTSNSQTGSIALTVLQTIQEMAEVVPIIYEIGASARAAQSLITTIGSSIDIVKSEGAVIDNSVQDLSGVKNDIIQAVNLLKQNLETQKKNQLARLDQLESAFIADVSLLEAVADDPTFAELKISDATKREVRRTIWSALLPLKTSLVGIPLQEDRKAFSVSAYKAPLTLSGPPTAGARLKAEREKFKACAANIALNSDACKPYQQEGFYGLFPDRTKFIFFTQSVPIYSSAFGACRPGKSCSVEYSSQFYGWALLVKPWRLPVTDPDKNGNDRSNFGEAKISREKTLPSGQAGSEQISVNAYVADLFDGPNDLYRVFMKAREAWGAGAYENTTYSPRKKKGAIVSEINSPENLYETSIFIRDALGTSGKLIGKFESIESEFALATRTLDLSLGPLPVQSTDQANFTVYAKYYDADFSWVPKDFGGGHEFEFKQATTVVHPLPHRLFWLKDGIWTEDSDEMTRQAAQVDEP